MLLGFSSTAALLAACGSQGAAPGTGGTGGTSNAIPASAGKPATIQYWTNWGAQFQAEGQTKVNQTFTQQVAPEITVEMTHVGNNLDKIISAVAAGTSPDVVTLSGGNVIQFARKSTIQPLDERVARSRIARKDKFFPAQIEAASWNGKWYGIPAWEHGPGPFLFWNKMHFQEKGLDPNKGPATLAEARQYAEKLHEPALGSPITRLGWQPLAESGDNLLNYWATAFGVTWYDAKNRKINLVQPGLVSAVEYITALTKRIGPEHLAEFRKQYPQWNAPHGASAQGAESMKVSGYVSAGVLAKNAPDLKLGIGWAPGEKAQKVVQLGGSWTVTMPAGAPQPEAGFRYMEFLTTPEANQLIQDIIGWVGYNKEVAQKLKIETGSNMQFALDAPTKAEKVLAPVVLPIATAPVGQGLQKVIAGDLAAREMLQQAQQQLQTELDEALRGS